METEAPYGLASVEHVFYPSGPWNATACSSSAVARSTLPSFGGSSSSRSRRRRSSTTSPATSCRSTGRSTRTGGVRTRANFCFARVTHTYMDMNAGRDFETKIVVKVNAPEVLRGQLASKRWKGEHIAMGTATDPYQRAEGRYKLMPGIIAALTEYRNPFSILTKGTLLLRDLPLLTEAAKVTDVSTA